MHMLQLQITTPSQQNMLTMISVQRCFKERRRFILLQHILCQQLADLKILSKLSKFLIPYFVGGKFEVTSSAAQGLVLALFSGITLGRLRVPYGMLLIEG